MKVCIVTVYNSINSGSYWQSMALKTCLEKMGFEVSFFHRKKKGTSSSIRQRVLSSLKYITSFRFKEFIVYNISFHKFILEQKKFNIIKSDDEFENIILGSDTIWNLNSDYFKNNIDIFWGSRFKGKKIITYAPSIANTKFEQVKSIYNVKGIINNWTCISVRDDSTYDVISQFTRKNIQIVCDPTLLLGKEDYKKFLNGRKIKSKYIFLYLFNELNSAQIIDIKDYAKKNGLKIIDGNYLRMKTDEKVNNSPMDFLNYLFYAEYVITDTFHGTIFSINLNKEFVVISREKKKVNDVLARFKLKSRLVESDKISPIFNQKIDYNYTNILIDDYRNESIAFINESLK